MNPIIKTYFDDIEVRLIQSHVIDAYQVLKREITPSDGKLRIKSFLTDGSVLEIFEYITEDDERIRLLKYSFHWQDKQKQLKQRWDNAPHHSDLPNFPHHVHNEDGTVEAVIQIPDTLSIISKLEQRIT